MVSRKRDRAEMESSEPTTESTTEPSILTRLRDMWEFSNLMQYIFIFGKAVKIDDEFTIEVDSPAISKQILDHTLFLLISGSRLIIFLWAYRTSRANVSKLAHRKN